MTEDDLLDHVRRGEGDATLAGLARRFPGVPRRTLQRRIARLLDEGRLEASGRGRARRYRLPERPSDVGRSDNRPFPEAVALSPDSLDILPLLARPLEARTPVGYQRELLDDYVPNRTFYLSDPLRAQLVRMGDIGDGERVGDTYGRRLLERLLIDLSWSSSRLEGSTYSRLDTARLIEEGHPADGKSAVETQMILNHKRAIELLVDNVEEVGFDRFTLLNLHATLAEDLLGNPADEGRLRSFPVEIGRSVYRPTAVPQLIEELTNMLLDKATRIDDPFEASFFVAVHVPYLQPFADVNKRTSRLLANLPLLRAGLCPLTFVGVSEQAYVRALLGVYELGRIELLRDLYVWAYERSTRELIVVKRDLATPDPRRRLWRETVRRTVRAVVRAPERDPLDAMRETLDGELDRDVDAATRAEVEAMVNEELRRLHEGVLARHGLRPSEFERWRDARLAP